MREFESEVGLQASGPSYHARFHRDKVLVEVLGGSGHPEHGPLTAYGFRNLTVKQASAMELGLRIFKYLETGKYPELDEVPISGQPGVEINYR